MVIKKEDPLSPEDEALKAVMLSVYIKKRPKTCFLCLGEDLPLNVRLYSFSLLSDISRHFKRKHLKHIKEGEAPKCKLCKMTLAHKIHLQNHALTIHGTVFVKFFVFFMGYASSMDHYIAYKYRLVLCALLNISSFRSTVVSTIGFRFFARCWACC